MTTVNTYSLNIDAPNFIKINTKGQKRQTRLDTVVMTSIPQFHQQMSQPDLKINEGTSEFICTIGQRGVIDNYGTFHPKTVQYTSI